MSANKVNELLVKSNLTAQDFITVWNNYDKEGNGFIKDEQLDAFLQDFLKKSSTPTSDQQFQQIKASFVNSADENKDGKLDINEVAKLLPLEESFLMLFRRNAPLNSSVQFMKKYDKNGDGSLDTKEVKEFLRDYHKQAAKEPLQEAKLNEYSAAVVQLFDSNKDGKLQIHEMAKLLPVENNFLGKVSFGSTDINKKDIEKLFKFYDK
ncbi:calbindin-32-like isoform X1, partial [Leptotrombidium deliense]